MNDVSWEPSEDPEVPTEDVIEQHQSRPGEGDEPDQKYFELPDEANEADVAEQRQIVPVEDDEDAYR